MNRIVHVITKGVDKVVVENLSVTGMTAHGENRKRTMNRMMCDNRAGTFLHKLKQKCGMSSRLPESYAQITLTVAISYA